ncbi:MAG: hypothetical protein U1F16_02640 [Turneriella sp.]
MIVTQPVRTFSLAAIPADLTVLTDETSVSGWQAEPQSLSATGTHFGFVVSGKVCVHSAFISDFVMPTGSYFSLTGPVDLIPQSPDSAGIVITRLGYEGFNHLGGPVEKQGRLKYIDGCTDSLLIAPPRKGDACLNLLHFPPHTDQTMHSHPSIRCGVVATGNGWCAGDIGTLPLETGMGFVIPADAMHKFQTGNGSMTVIAYHPDSDFGPDDDNHPMINRTIVDGQSARYNAGIRTR